MRSDVVISHTPRQAAYIVGTKLNIHDDDDDLFLLISFTITDKR